MSIQERYEYLYQVTPEGNAKLLAVRGYEPLIRLPESIEGHPLTALGEYCFSRLRDIPSDAVWTKTEDSDGMQLLCGNAVEEIWLPDAVAEIGALAFYDCRKLREVSMGAGLTSLGSDAFMNCRALERVALRCGVDEPSGAKLILQQVRMQMEIRFCLPDGSPEAALLYPEYTEGYQEIGPAHIFALQMEGEGFRARQCFRDRVVDLSAYDDVFPRIALEEKTIVAGEMALLRLAWPAGLTEEHRLDYEAYVRAHGYALACIQLEMRGLSMLQLLCELRLLAPGELAEIITAASRMEWAEGTAALMQWQKQYYGGSTGKRYDLIEW